MSTSLPSAPLVSPQALLPRGASLSLSIYRTLSSGDRHTVEALGSESLKKNASIVFGNLHENVFYVVYLGVYSTLMQRNFEIHYLGMFSVLQLPVCWREGPDSRTGQPVLGALSGRGVFVWQRKCERRRLFRCHRCTQEQSVQCTLTWIKSPSCPSLPTLLSLSLPLSLVLVEQIPYIVYSTQDVANRSWEIVYTFSEVPLSLSLL